MMLPTHVLVGMTLALPLVVIAPEHGQIALVAGLLGGAWPDFDLYAGHRRTLHFPVYYTVLTAIAVPVALLFGTSLAVGLVFFLLGAAVHSLADVLGGGLELRPWEGRSDRAVYSHHHGRWLEPYRWIRYDGAPEDLALSVTLAAPLLTVLESPLRTVVFVTLAVAVVYAAVRRVLPTLAESLVPLVPEPTKAYVPNRYLGSEDSRASSSETRRPDGG